MVSRMSWVVFFISATQAVALRLKRGWVKSGDGWCMVGAGMPPFAAATGTQVSGIDDDAVVAACQQFCEDNGFVTCIVALSSDNNLQAQCLGVAEPCAIPSEFHQTDDVSDNPDIAMVRTFELTAGPSSSAVGDPHCSNAKGDKFDITILTKRIPMIILPQNSSADSANMILYADTTPNVWSDCAPPFFRAFEVRVKDCVLSFDLGGSIFPAVSKAGNWMSEGCAAKIDVKEDGLNGILVQIPSTEIKMKIFQIETLHKKQVFKFLNLEVSGKSLADAGGILGNDPYDWVSNDGNKLCTRALRNAAGPLIGSRASVI